MEAPLEEGNALEEIAFHAIGTRLVVLLDIVGRALDHILGLELLELVLLEQRMLVDAVAVLEQLGIERLVRVGHVRIRLEMSLAPRESWVLLLKVTRKKQLLKVKALYLF